MTGAQVIALLVLVAGSAGAHAGGRYELLALEITPSQPASADGRYRVDASAKLEPRPNRGTGFDSRQRWSIAARRRCRSFSSTASKADGEIANCSADVCGNVVELGGEMHATGLSAPLSLLR